MTLRARLVAALVALLTVGMVVYGVGTYQAFAQAELDRLDEDLRVTTSLVTRELVGPGFDDRGGGGEGPGGDPRDRGRAGGPDGPRVVVAPGTFAQLYGAGGEVLDTIQITDASTTPDLSEVRLDGDRLVTTGSIEAATQWRVAVDALSDGRTVVAAVPMTSVDRALERLLAIETVAGAALVALLAAGAWMILRSGLRPLERMATTARSISAGSLDQRVEVPGSDNEVGQLASALNGMLDDLEDAFREREETEAKLRRFLADASHELRTPLTSIQGFAELFRLGPDSEHVDLPVIMRRIEEESDRMRRLVEDLLTLARLDETHPVERAPVDLAVLAADACSDAVAMAPDRPVRLDAPQPVPIAGDAAHLRQAIGNLVANALKHTPTGTPLEVSAHRADGRAVVRIRDHGPGLDHEALDHAFDRFWQADPARVGVGTGLGLSIVQAVAGEHGGTVTADNAADGTGAVFTITIPTSEARSRTSIDLGAPVPSPSAAPEDLR